MSDRIEILKNSVNNAIRAICPERAILWTEYYKNKLNRNKPVEIQAAEAMCYVLQNKSIEIYPDELVVGNPIEWEELSIQKRQGFRHSLKFLLFINVK